MFKQSLLTERRNWVITDWRSSVSIMLTVNGEMPVGAGLGGLCAGCNWTRPHQRRVQSIGGCCCTQDLLIIIRRILGSDGLAALSDDGGPGWLEHRLGGAIFCAVGGLRSSASGRSRTLEAVMPPSRD